MRDFKKTLAAVALFLLFLCGFSFVLIHFYDESAYARESDRKIRDDLAGQIDLIVAGASHTQYGFIPAVMDEELGCFSYNLSGAWQNLYGTRMLLEQELARNPVKAVYYCVTEDTMWAKKDSDSGMGDVKILPKLSGVGERIDYLVHSITLSEAPDIYHDLMDRGCRYFWSLFRGEPTDNAVPEDRGFNPTDTRNRSLSKKKAKSTKNSRQVNAAFDPQNEAWLDDIIALCREQDVPLVFVVPPVTDKMIWQMDGWDDLYVKMTAWCAERGVTLWDFNLYRGRYELFTDKTSFYDDAHLSTDGAEVFTRLLADTVKRTQAGEDISGDFYTSYEEMKADSPYNKK